jgi:hypothetical protein
MVLADQQHEILRAYDFRKAKRLRGDSAFFLTSLVLLVEGNWRTLLDVNFEILSSRRLIGIPGLSLPISVHGVGVSKATALEEIVLDIVKLLRSYFR